MSNIVSFEKHLELGFTKYDIFRELWVNSITKGLSILDPQKNLPTNAELEFIFQSSEYIDYLHSKVMNIYHSDFPFLDSSLFDRHIAPNSMQKIADRLLEK